MLGEVTLLKYKGGWDRSLQEGTACAREKKRQHSENRVKESKIENTFLDITYVRKKINNVLKLEQKKGKEMYFSNTVKGRRTYRRD